MSRATVIHRALTAMVGALFAILYVGAGAVAAPAAKPAQNSNTAAALQGHDGSEARVAYAPASQSDEATQLVGHDLAGLAPDSGFDAPAFANDVAAATLTSRTSRTSPAPAGRAPPA